MQQVLFKKNEPRFAFIRNKCDRAMILDFYKLFNCVPAELVDFYAKALFDIPMYYKNSMAFFKQNYNSDAYNMQAFNTAIFFKARRDIRHGIYIVKPQICQETDQINFFVYQTRNSVNEVTHFGQDSDVKLVNDLKTREICDDTGHSSLTHNSDAINATTITQCTCIKNFQDGANALYMEPNEKKRGPTWPINGNRRCDCGGSSATAKVEPQQIGNKTNDYVAYLSPYTKIVSFPKGIVYARLELGNGHQYVYDSRTININSKNNDGQVKLEIVPDYGGLDSGQGLMVVGKYNAIKAGHVMSHHGAFVYWSCFTDNAGDKDDNNLLIQKVNPKHVLDQFPFVKDDSSM